MFRRNRLPAVAAFVRETVALSQQPAVRRKPLAEWALTLLLLLFGTTTLVQAYVIPTGSMEGTLLVGDHVLVDKLAYAPAGAMSRLLLPYSPIRRGDIIVFRWPSNLQANLVKRVIGLPGDRIRIADKQVYCNGKALQEPYKVHSDPGRLPFRDTWPALPLDPQVDAAGRAMFQQHVHQGELVVPPGHYFALGDNRDASLDSRYWGLVPRENIIGKPLAVFWSYEAETRELVQVTPSFAHLKDLALHLASKTRWSRTGHLLRGHRFEEAN